MSYGLPIVNRELGIFPQVQIQDLFCRRGLGAVVAFLVLGLFGCGGRPAPLPAPAPPKSVADYFTLAVGGRPVQMQLAVLPPEMEHGLMGRRDLGSDQGMIFVYDRPQRLNFWMRNTPTPLDIGYFTPEGRLAEVYAMYPSDERPLTSRRADLQFALEMNQGWFRDRAVRPGARLDLAALAAALRAPGFAPGNYGLR